MRKKLLLRWSNSSFYMVSFCLNPRAFGTDDGIVARTQQICKTEAVFGEGVGQNTGRTLIAGTVAVRAGRHDEMMLLA